MGERGRKSAAELSVIVPARAAFKPPAPDYLPPEQKAEWNAIVRRMPQGWFGRENYPLLVSYVRHIAFAGKIAEQLEAMRPDSLRDPEVRAVFGELSRLHERETRALSSLATRLRLSPSSRLKAETAATRAAKTIDAEDVSALWGGDEGNDMARLENPEKVP